MKHAHRSAHKAIWIIAAPLLVAILIGALKHRQDVPVNDAVPSVQAEAR